MIKPQNRADGLVVWENVGPDDECEWSHGRAGRAWIQLSDPDSSVLILGTLSPELAPVKISELHALAMLAVVDVPSLVCPKVTFGTTTILMQR